MKILAELLFTLLLADVVWGAPPQARPTPPRAANNACEQEWQAMAQRHREEADALLKESSGQRSLLTMLRNDAGIVRDSTVRDALQVNADMWEMMLGRLQHEAASLQALAEQEESKQQALCSSR
ncbi:MAG TPA: hypothetical protein VJN48_05080 [Terriglobales bacterium]|nr:hypothetical protein [Terriglobales bacterium]